MSSWLAKTPGEMLPAGVPTPSANPNMSFSGLVVLAAARPVHLDLVSFHCLRIKHPVARIPARLDTGAVANGCPERSRTSLMNAAFPGRNRGLALHRVAVVNGE